MKYLDAVRNAGAAFRATLAGRHEDRIRPPRGDVFMELRNAYTGALELKREKRNIVVKDASILIARLIKDSQEPEHGAYVLGVGSGDIGWNPLSPPEAIPVQRSLFAEITRKTFASSQFVDGDGVPVGRPTNVVDFTTFYTESEAVGPLVEMGLIGGDVSSNLAVRNPVTPPNGPYDATVDLTTAETLLNYLTFPVISKPATSTFQIIWRLTF